MGGAASTISSNETYQHLKNSIENFNSNQNLDNSDNIDLLKNKLEICSLIYNLSLVDENKILLVEVKELKVIELFIEILQNDNKNYNELKIVVLKSLIEISVPDGNKLFLCSSELKLTDELSASLKKETNEEILTLICQFLWNISMLSESKVCLSAAGLDLISSIIKIVTHSTGELRAKAVGILMSLSTLPENKKSFSSLDAGLIPHLIGIIKEDTADPAMSCALGCLWNISGASNAVRSYLCSSEFDLIPRLIQIMKNPDVKIRRRICGLVRSLAVNPSTKKYLISKELGLIFSLVEVLQKEEESEVTVQVCITFMSLVTTSEDNADQLCSPEVGLLSAVHHQLVIEYDRYVRQLANEEERVGIVSEILDNLVKTVWNLSESCSSTGAMEVIKMKIHDFLLDIVKGAGPDKDTWKVDKMKGRSLLVSNSINAIMNISRHYSIASKPLIDSGALETFKEISSRPSNGVESLKAIFIITFLVGREESDKCIIHQRKGAVEELLQVFADTLNRKKGKDFPLGTFCVKLIVNACLVLSCSDTLKSSLASSELVGLLKTVIEAFAKGDKPIPNCGGGGNDVESAELAIETLLQLSFLFDDDDDLRNKLFTKDMQILALIDSAIQTEKLRPAGLRDAKSLRSRLIPVVKDEKVMEEKVDSKEEEVGREISNGTHIMLSYCWSKNSKPELVKDLGSALRSEGYEIWRDEEGSSLVPPMSGGADERMAEALDRSSVVIVFVSRDYKDRPNCRMEAKYANQLMKRGKLQIIYIMMQNEYTTVSSPDYCDGWLGIMIGDAIWYPLWSSSLLDNTVKALLSVIGNKAKIQSKHANNVGNSTQKDVPVNKRVEERVEIVSKPSSAVVRDFNAAYNFLLIDSKVRNKVEMLNKLDDLGIEVPEDLGELDNEFIAEIVSMVKPAQRKRFLRFLDI